MSESFGGRVYRARLALGARRGQPVTQTELGRTLGVSGVTVGAWESGTSEPANLAALERLADALGVSPSWLAFGGESYPLAEPLPGRVLTKTDDPDMPAVKKKPKTARRN